MRLWLSGFLLCAALPAQPPALNSLAQGAKALDEKRYAEALGPLDRALRGVPALADYAAYLGAAARFELGQYGQVEAALQPVWHRTPVSPLTGKAAILLANAYLKSNRPAAVPPLVKEHSAALKPPEAEALLAHAAQAQGQTAVALTHFRRLLTEYPLAAEALDADLSQLTPAGRLARCVKLLEGDPGRARRELEQLIPALQGPQLDTARVKLGQALYALRDNAGAYRTLQDFQAAAPETEAERLYNLIRCARRLDRPEDFRATLDQLAAGHAHSPWRVQSLLAAGDFYWMQNAPAAYEPVYRACADTFPADGRAAECLWRLAFSAYVRRAPDAGGLLQTFLKRYPEAEKAANARYFLARLADARNDAAAAQAGYADIAARYANYFYGVLARERLHQVPAVAPAAVSFTPSPISRARAERARLLASAGLDDLAESELRFGAKTDGQPEAAALELAELAGERGAPDRGIRAIKQLAPHYLRLPIDPATGKFWKLAFPLPFRESLERYSRDLGLDPFLVAALIRQESEFNPKAVSRANAHGLTQVLPSTGREIGRKLKLSGLRAGFLFQPETNLQIGTYFFRSLLDRLQGRWEAALASYNAGPGRVAKWLTWGEFREPAEFIESIPFDETRNYVQSVYRNADLYRRLYGNGPGALASTHGGHGGEDAGTTGGDRKPASAVP